jgi:hypothetical protein
MLIYGQVSKTEEKGARSLIISTKQSSTLFYSCVPLLVAPDDSAFLKTAHTIYRKLDKYPEAITLAIKLGDKEMIEEDFESCQDP